ncbi:hypothetical protein Pla52n_22780 [Stieleria varia]|uniref:Uncharacterized protein n=1 Tax=Stieleria varia TaxID=2528005 RepID=A0A5C6AYK3_9BACT|nr:hypothetical protein Pla52n_22780 [Stieleria varia]
MTWCSSSGGNATRMSREILELAAQMIEPRGRDHKFLLNRVLPQAPADGAP